MGLTVRLHNIFIEPFCQGVDNLSTSFGGKRVERIAANAIGSAAAIATREIDVSFCDRVSHFVVGLLLLIPLINAVVFAILQMLNSSFVYPRELEIVNRAEPASTTSRPLPYANWHDGIRRYGDPHNPENQFDNRVDDHPLQRIDRLRAELTRPEDITAADEAYVQMRNNGEALLLEAALQHAPAVTPIEYQRRKQLMIDLLRQAEEDPNHLYRNLDHFRCPDEVLEFDLDQILERFDEYHEPRQLFEFFDYANVPLDKRIGVENFVFPILGMGTSRQYRPSKNC